MKNYQGLGLLDVVQIVLIILKLLKIIDWPWVYVLIPFWISIVLLIIVLVGLSVYWLIFIRRR